MKLTLHLADAAIGDSNGKVSALGLGWSIIDSPMPAHALVLFVEIDPDEAGRKHTMVGDLVNEDGRIAAVDQDHAYHFDGEFEIAAAGPTTAGAGLMQAFAIPVPPGIALAPGRRWEYRVTVGGEVASVGFSTRP